MTVMDPQQTPNGRAPQELVDILRPHLAKVGPLMKLPADGGVSVYALYVEGAATNEHGSVAATGEGTLIGPLDLSKREAIYTAYGGHMPSLRNRLESAVFGKLLIVTCEIGGAGDGKKIHYAVVGVQ